MMKRLKAIVQAACLALVLTPSTGAAQDFDLGFRAWMNGYMAGALREW